MRSLLSRFIVVLFYSGVATNAYSDEYVVLSRSMEEILLPAFSNTLLEYKKKTNNDLTVVTLESTAAISLSLKDRSSCWVSSYDDVLDELNAMAVIGNLGEKDSLFRGIDDSFLRTNQNWVVWAGIGWIPWNETKVKGKGECNPKDEWPTKHCIEKHDSSTFFVKILAGHPGFPIYGFSHSNFCNDNGNFDNTVTDVINSDTSSVHISDYFLAVAVDSVRKQRSITFELYEKNNEGGYHRIKSTTDSRPVCQDCKNHPKPSTGARNTCGGKSSACPSFFTPDGGRKEKLEFDEFLERNEFMN